MITLTIISGIIFTIFAGITEGVQQRENHIVLTEAEEIRLNKLWHTTQLCERLGTITFGFMLSQTVMIHDVWVAVAVLLFVHANYWIFYNGLINLYLNRNFFHQTKTSTSTIDNLFDRLGLPMIVVQVLYYIGALSFLWTQLP